MKKYNLSFIKQNNLVLLEAITGSVAYGTNIPGSDVDIRGVFLLSEADFFGLEKTDEVSDKKQDIKFYELHKFVSLLLKNNPNILELLNIPNEFIKYKSPLLDLLKPTYFLSKLCKVTFGSYAIQQIKKARGLNKKIVNPMDKERKSILDFCYCIDGSKTFPLKTFLDNKSWLQQHCGIVNIPHAKNTFALYYDFGINNPSIPIIGYRGVTKDFPEANDLRLSSIPNEEVCQAIFHYNKEGYQKYCNDYRNYWNWVSDRNKERYESNVQHGKNYDSKNMAHCFRLLDMAKEIANESVINVKRPNRDFLLKIRSGDFDYDYLVKKAEEKIAELDEIYLKSDLPEKPNIEKANHLLFEIRKKFYTSII